LQTAEKIRSSFQSKELKGFQYWDTEIFCRKKAIIILLQNGENYDLFYAASVEKDFSELDELMEKITRE
jgi:hypothetical protein